MRIAAEESELCHFASRRTSWVLVGYAPLVPRVRAAAHDEIAGWEQSVESADAYREELARRDASEQTRTMLVLTRWIAAFTVANVTWWRTP